MKVNIDISLLEITRIILEEKKMLSNYELEKLIEIFETELKYRLENPTENE